MSKVLFLGENWYGSSSRACSFALRRLACDVLDVDSQAVFPNLHTFSGRLWRRLGRDILVREYNELVLRSAENIRPDFVLAFKASLLRADTLRRLRALGCRLYNYYPDTSVFSHGSHLPQALPEYDVVFHTKPFFVRDVCSRLQIKQAVFVPHGYDPEIHRPMTLDDGDWKRYACDVAFIGVHTSHKEDMMQKLLRLRPQLNLRIWGYGWERCHSPALRSHVEDEALFGEFYAKAIQVAKINLAILSGKVEGASQGDETTTRTFEIPACGGFMLHERTPEVLTLFKENQEIACFDSSEELAGQIDSFLAEPEKRARLAVAGRRRCVPHYSYDQRMKAILDWHQKQNPSSSMETIAVGDRG